MQEFSDCRFSAGSKAALGQRQMGPKEFVGTVEELHLGDLDSM